MDKNHRLFITITIELNLYNMNNNVYIQMKYPSCCWIVDFVDVVVLLGLGEGDVMLLDRGSSLVPSGVIVSLGYFSLFRD